MQFVWDLADNVPQPLTIPVRWEHRRYPLSILLNYHSEALGALNQVPTDHQRFWIMKRSPELVGGLFRPFRPLIDMDRPILELYEDAVLVSAWRNLKLQRFGSVGHVMYLRPCLTQIAILPVSKDGRKEISDRAAFISGDAFET